MKSIYLIFIAVFLISCGKEPHPKEIYKAYVADVQEVEKLSEFPFSSYLSRRAQEYTAAQMDRSGIIINNFSINGSPSVIKNIKTDSLSMKSDKMKSLFLELWKSEAVIPSKYSEKWRLGDKNAEWQFVDKEFLDPDTQLKDSTLKTIVHFVNENGWKIDKIERTRTSKDGSTMKSITY
ncbi:MAG: hypothetical protein ACFE0K_04255 [Alcanivorax sp.]|uniref:hypothetical protein n=1 Tax=Alcanivorax sp. TaxID=1872427 RepID=UPI003DA780D1